MKNSNKLIGISEETKETLDKMKIHPRETYNDLIKRNLSEFSFLDWQMPIPVRVHTNLNIYEGFIIADAGSVLWLIFESRVIGNPNLKGTSQTNLTSKRTLNKIEILEDYPFDLNISSCRQASYRFPEQWEKSKIPKVIDCNAKILKELSDTWREDWKKNKGVGNDHTTK